MDFLFVLAVGLVAGTLSGIVGFGSSVLLMPVLVIAFGPKEAVPIMAIAAIMANISRVMVWWRAIDWRICGAYAATAVPCAALGARTLLIVPPHAVEIALGLFFILMIGGRRWMAARRFRLAPWQLSVIAVPVGFLTGVVASTGPITVPIFLAAGLVKGAFLSTEASASLLVYAAKAIVFRSFGALPLDIVLEGLIVGSSLMVGAFVAKRFVLSMDAARFSMVMDGLMLVSGGTLLWAAIFS